jgi:hypothetical protein
MIGLWWSKCFLKSQHHGCFIFSLPLQRFRPRMPRATGGPYPFMEPMTLPSEEKAVLE